MQRKNGEHRGGKNPLVRCPRNWTDGNYHIFHEKFNQLHHLQLALVRDMAFLAPALFSCFPAAVAQRGLHSGGHISQRDSALQIEMVTPSLLAAAAKRRLSSRISLG
jgi:hypothetical protein